MTDSDAPDTLRMTGILRRAQAVQKDVSRSEGFLQSWYCLASYGLFSSGTGKADNSHRREAMYAALYVDKSYIGKSLCGEV